MKATHVGMINRIAKKNRLLAAGLIATTAVWLGANVLADDASSIEQNAVTGQTVQYDNASGAYPVITAVGSMPGLIGGHNYTSWSAFAQDATGSLDLFISGSTLTTLTANVGATLNVGDAVNVAGQWGPFDQIPELGFSTTPTLSNHITTVSSGNALPAAPVFTISQVALSPISNHVNIAGYYLEIDNVTITGTNGLTMLPGYTTSVGNETFTMTDNTGSVTMFDWTTSYSSAEMLTGTPIGASYQYDVKGFVDNFGTTPEFTPLSVTAVPEPSTMALVGLGLMGSAFVARRRRQ